MLRNIEGFSKEIYYKLCEFKYFPRKPYANIFLNPNYITSEEESIIIDFLNSNYDIDDFISLRNNVLLHLCFELGLRPIQIFNLDCNDFYKVSNNNTLTNYYSLNTALAKKLSNSGIEKRNKAITERLGEKIERLIHLNQEEFQYIKTPALFRMERGKYRAGERLSKIEISKIICSQLQQIGFEKGNGATLLRHHLAQSLANQGTPADAIAEILGHNSTLPARAYVAATPEIAVIKTRALGKSKTYGNIMKMLLTGEVMEKDSVSKDRWIRGMIGSQYIGGIGSCGLPNNTACPKNLVYSCYTCHKFHPFVEGRHEEVKKELQVQVQYFIDIAEKSMDLEYNRPVVQLEKTIEAVDAVIERCNSTNSNS